MTTMLADMTPAFVQRYARDLTREQFHEMFIIHGLDLWHRKTRCPIRVEHSTSWIYDDLIAHGLVKWVPGGPVGGGWRKRDWGTPHLTTLGQRVLMRRIETHLAKDNAFPEENGDE